MGKIRRKTIEDVENKERIEKDIVKVMTKTIRVLKTDS
jgi:hypothetical protein